MNEDNKTLKQELIELYKAAQGYATDPKDFAEAYLKAVRDRLPKEITMKNMMLNGSVRCDGRYNQALTEVREILGGNDE